MLETQRLLLVKLRIAPYTHTLSHWVTASALIVVVFQMRALLSVYSLPRAHSTSFYLAQKSPSILHIPQLLHTVLPALPIQG